MSTAAGRSLEETAQELFGILTRFALLTQAHQRRGVELKEFEFLTLTVLHVHGRMIVGDIQRILGVLPAQMSRIIRALENRRPPLIECQINSKDKRKVDVQLTAVGIRALSDFQEHRVQKLMRLLQGMSEDEHDDLGRLIVRLSDRLKEASEELQRSSHS